MRLFCEKIVNIRKSGPSAIFRFLDSGFSLIYSIEKERKAPSFKMAERVYEKKKKIRLFQFRYPTGIPDDPGTPCRSRLSHLLYER